MDSSKPTTSQAERTDVVKVEAQEQSAAEAPLFDRYVVKVDVSISAGAVPTGHPPFGY